MAGPVLLLGLVALLLPGCSWAGGLPLPSYLKPCARHDPKLNECVLKHGREAIPRLVKGDRKYHVPPMNPLEIKEIQIVEGGARQASFSMKLKDVKVYGMPDAHLEYVNYDLDKKRLRQDLQVPRNQIIGKYELSGRVLLLPINGNGDINITMDNVKISTEHLYELKDRGGETFGEIQDTVTTVEPGRMYIHLTNLFNGDKLLGDTTNNFLNENWREVYKELSPTVIAAMGQVFEVIAKGLIGSVKFDDLIPETVAT